MVRRPSLALLVVAVALALAPLAGADEGEGTAWVLVVGIDAYRDAAIPKLDYAQADARAVTRFFARDAKSPTRGGCVRALYGKAATRANVLAQVERHLARNAVGPRDTAILYFAGHGFTDARGDFYLACQDTALDNLFGTGISQTELATAWRRIDAGRKLLVVDACHAGALKGVRGIGGVKLPEAAAGSVTLAATAASQRSVEDPGRGHGVFTLALLEGLAGAAAKKDGVVTASSLADYVSEVVPRLAARNGGEQTPAVEGRGDFALTRTREPRLPPGVAAECVEEGDEQAPSRTGLLIKSDPPGARVILDDARDVGRTPAPVDVAPGKHKLLVSLEGHEAVEREVTVAEGERKVVDVALRRAEVPVQRPSLAGVWRRSNGLRLRLERAAEGRFAGKVEAYPESWPEKVTMTVSLELEGKAVKGHATFTDRAGGGGLWTIKLAWELELGADGNTLDGRVEEADWEEGKVYSREWVNVRLERQP